MFELPTTTTMLLPAYQVLAFLLRSTGTVLRSTVVYLLVVCGYGTLRTRVRGYRTIIGDGRRRTGRGSGANKNTVSHDTREWYSSLSNTAGYQVVQ